MESNPNPEKYRQKKFIKYGMINQLIYLILMLIFILTEIVIDHRTVVVFEGYQIFFYIMLILDLILLRFSIVLIKKFNKGECESVDWEEVIEFGLFCFLFNLISTISLILLECLFLFFVLIIGRYSSSGFGSKPIVLPHIQFIFPVLILYNVFSFVMIIKLYRVFEEMESQYRKRSSIIPNDFDIYNQDAMIQDREENKIFSDSGGPETKEPEGNYQKRY